MGGGGCGWVGSGGSGASAVSTNLVELDRTGCSSYDVGCATRGVCVCGGSGGGGGDTDRVVGPSQCKISQRLDVSRFLFLCATARGNGRHRKHFTNNETKILPRKKKTKKTKVLTCANQIHMADG